MLLIIHLVLVEERELNQRLQRETRQLEERSDYYGLEELEGERNI